jgi:hypothetical protein
VTPDELGGVDEHAARAAGRLEDRPVITLSTPLDDPLANLQHRLG